MERVKIAFSMFAETVMIAAMCLVIGLGAGNAMAQPIADGMLEGRVAAAMETDSASEGGNKVLFAGGQMQTNDNAAGYVPESEIQVSLSMSAIIQIIIATLALSSLSGIVGAVVITQYEPLKILRERT
jgi:ABC-type antimicrobial peptide transport system permease subunit